MKNIARCIMALLTMMAGFSMLNAQDKGYEIMKKNDELKEAKDVTSDITLVLVNKNGNKKQRKMKLYSKKRKEGYDSFFEILSPADVEGMRFLTLARKGDDEQRMFLPALGKSRKISGSSKDGKFLGSDLYFYDLEDHDFDDFTYKFIKEEVWEGHEYYVVELYPKDKKAPYSKVVDWVRKDNYFVYKEEMYDKSQDRHIKTLLAKEVIEIDGIMIAAKMKIINHKDKHQTFYVEQNHKVNAGMIDNIFTVKNLEN